MEYVEIPKDKRFFVRFTEDQVNFSSGVQGTHNTLMFGRGTKIAELHYTQESKFGSEKNQHSRNKYLRHFTIGRIIVRLKETVPGIERLFTQSQIPLGVIKRLDFVLIKINDIQTQEVIRVVNSGTVIKLQKRIRKEVLNDMIGCVCCLRKATSLQGFIAYRQVKGRLENAGFVFAYPQMQSSKKVIFISQKRMLAFGRRITEEIKGIVKDELTEEKQQQLSDEVNHLLAIFKARPFNQDLESHAG